MEEWSYDVLSDIWRLTRPIAWPITKKPKAPKRATFTTWRCNYPAYDTNTSQERLRELAACTHWMNVMYRQGTDHIISVKRETLHEYRWLWQWRSRFDKSPLIGR
jgi:hypothetical protein